jgi:hypothetical protein
VIRERRQSCQWETSFGEAPTEEALNELTDAIEAVTKKLGWGHKCDVICLGCKAGTVPGIELERFLMIGETK